MVRTTFAVTRSALLIRTTPTEMDFPHAFAAEEHLAT